MNSVFEKIFFDHANKYEFVRSHKSFTNRIIINLYMKKY